MKVELKPQAIKDICGLQEPDAARIAKKLSELERGLTGDIKRLTNFTPEYGLRVGCSICRRNALIRSCSFDVGYQGSPAACEHGIAEMRFG